ncbi:T9SS C-terminal target domain-containing protein [Spirosoma flavum]|uniref:T9SS C-terminal target domain-containing protein n=1 Tax=Spirosoma flavum TaxID=2048557 RepID=A0ABW6AU05_9BACT
MIKLLVLMLGLVATTAPFAQQTILQTPAASTYQARLLVTANQKIRLYIQPQSTKGLIILRDAQDHPLYTATVTLKEGFGQQFDITDLAVGTYRLTVTTGTATATKTFIVQPVPNQTFIVQTA